MNNKEKILSVDDNESNLYAIRRILEKEGYEIIEATSGKEVFERLNEKPDMVILDVNLPDVSGFEVCRQLKSRPEFDNVPVLQVSASFVKSSDKVTGLNSGADGYLAQPIDASVLVATVRSLLRIRKAEREKAALIEKLRAEQEIRERFVAMLTHDLRTPLAAARMSAELLIRSSNVPENEKGMVSRIVSNIDRTDVMIQDLLDANLIRAGERLPLTVGQIDMVVLIRQIIEDFELSFGPRFELKAPNSIEGYWSQSALKRVMENLLNNALKYGSPDGKISVLIQECKNDDISLGVHNFGKPIPVSEQATLFDKFKRASTAKQGEKIGWGLGLVLVRGVAEAHGGSAAVTSSEEAGTLFSIRIPKDSRPHQIKQNEIT